MLTNMLLDWELTQIQVLLIVMALIFLLGWPLEWVPIVLIIVPILIPLLDKMGINLTWFGILVAVNLQTAWLSATGGAVRLFPQGGGPGMGPQGHLHRHDAVHGDPAHRARRGPHVPPARPLAPIPVLRLAQV